MMIPIILTSIIGTIYDSKKLNGKLLWKTVSLFIIMFVITFLLTVGVTWLIKPGIGFAFSPVEWSGNVESLSYSDMIINLFPSNLIDMMQKNAIFATILFALVFGMAATKTKNGEKVIEVIEGLKEIFYQILKYILYLTPVATLSLVGTTVANYGEILIGVGLKYIGMAYLCGFLALIFVMILPAWIFAKVSPLKYIQKASKVWLMTVTTCSSAATLPTTMKVCEEEFGISQKVTNIVVPLGCTIHMCGGAVSFALLGIFCCQLFGIAITPLLFFQMILGATIINMAAPGIPNGGIVIGATYLALLGIPLEFIGFYSGIYKLLDMAYTTLNVTGDITANMILNHSLKLEEVAEHEN